MDKKEETKIASFYVESPNSYDTNKLIKFFEKSNFNSINKIRINYC